MPYLNEAGLSRYDPKLKEWIGDQPVKTLPPSLYPWTLSEKAGAVTCWPVGGTEMKPTVAFMFSETGPASGTKGPDNPSAITGVSSITVTRCETVGVDETAYTVNLGSTYYGGTLDVATGVMTVTWTMYDVGQAVAAYASGSQLFLFDGEQSSRPMDAVCEAFNFSAAGLSELQNGDFRYQTGGSGGVPEDATRWVFKATDYTTVEDFKSAFAGRKLVYPLANPFTVQLTPTQILSLTQSNKYTPRLNTIYTDASAVQVGYVKSPIREEQELTQAIVAQGGNI